MLIFFGNVRSVTKIWWYDWFWLLESTFFQIRSKCVPFQSVYSNFTLDFLNFRKGDVNQFQRYCFKSFIGNTNKKWTIYWKFATWSVHIVSLVRGDDTSTCSTNRRDFLLVVVAICDRVSYFHKLSSFLWMSWIISVNYTNRFMGIRLVRKRSKNAKLN